MLNNMDVARTLEEARASLQKQQREITTVTFLTTMRAYNRNLLFSQFTSTTLLAVQL